MSGSFPRSPFLSICVTRSAYRFYTPLLFLFGFIILANCLSKLADAVNASRSFTASEDGLALVLQQRRARTETCGLVSCTAALSEDVKTEAAAAAAAAAAVTAAPTVLDTEPQILMELLAKIEILERKLTAATAAAARVRNVVTISAV